MNNIEDYVLDFHSSVELKNLGFDMPTKHVWLISRQNERRLLDRNHLNFYREPVGFVFPAPMLPELMEAVPTQISIGHDGQRYYYDMHLVYEREQIVLKYYAKLFDRVYYEFSGQTEFDVFVMAWLFFKEMSLTKKNYEQN